MDLRALRKERAGSLSRASAAWGIPMSTLGCWETGTRRLTPGAVRRLSRALGMSEDEVRRAAPKRARVDFVVSVSRLTREWLGARSERKGVSVGAVLDALVDGELRGRVDRR